MLREVAGLCGVGMRNELIPAGSGAEALSPPCSLGTGWDTPRTSSRVPTGPRGAGSMTSPFSHPGFQRDSLDRP